MLVEVHCNVLATCNITSTLSTTGTNITRTGD